MKKIIGILCIGVIGFSLTSCSSPEPEPQPTVTVTAEAETKMVDVPDVNNLPADQAHEILTQLGLDVTFKESVWAKSNWTVTGQSIAAGEKAEEGSTVILDVIKIAPPASTEPAYDPNGPVTDSATAGTACEQYGSNQYPYGFKSHYILGVIGEEQRPDGTYFIKTEATVTNTFNAEGSFVMECVVSGTGDNPVVSSFLVY